MAAREEHTRFSCTPNAATPVALRRAAAGQWSVDFKVDVQIDLPDGRTITVTKTVTTRATGYAGFKAGRPFVRAPLPSGDQV